MIKIAIIGSRDYDDFEHVEIIMQELCNKFQDDLVIVSGGARGIDKKAEEVSELLEIDFHCYRAKWKKYGKKAGIIRNEKLINHSDAVIAFWDGESKGTLNSIKYAQKNEMPILIIMSRQIFSMKNDFEYKIISAQELGLRVQESS